MDDISDFKSAMSAAGISPPTEILADGQLHRFHVDGDKPRSKNGWYILFDDGFLAGSFGCWKRGIQETWSSREYETLTSKEKARYKANMEATKRQREEEQARIHSECQEVSTSIWEKAKPASDDHAYLRKKGVKAYGLREYKSALIVPVYGTSGTLHGLQFINADGSKRFKTGTQKAANYHAIGGKPESVLYLAEGYATGATIHQATGDPVAVCFDAGNLKAVAVALSAKYPKVKLVVCADNDQFKKENTGVTKATEAALAVDALLCVVHFTDIATKPTDFNDLYQLEGLDEVRRQIEAAVKPNVDVLLEDVSPDHKSLVAKLRPGSYYAELDVQINWIINGYVPELAVVLLFGRGGMGKTTLVMQIFGAVSKGRDVLGIQTSKRPVIYVDYENSLPVLAERCRNIDTSGILFLDSTSKPPKLDKSERVQYLELLKSHPNAVIIFDTLKSAHSGDENDSRPMSDVMGFLRGLRDAGATVIILHHTPKGNSRQYKGSGAIFDLCDHVLALYPVKKPGDESEIEEEDDADLTYRFGTSQKTRYEPARMFLSFDSDTRRFVTAPDPDVQNFEKVKQTMLKLQARFTVINQKSVIDELAPNIPNNKVRSLLKSGAGKYWTAEKGSHNSTVYTPIQASDSSLSVCHDLKEHQTDKLNLNKTYSDKLSADDTLKTNAVTEFDSWTDTSYQTDKLNNQQTIITVPDNDFLFEEVD